MWLIIGLLILGWNFYRHGWGPEVQGWIPLIAFIAVVIYFVLPALMITGTNPEDPNGAPIAVGLAVRGYGLMMLLAICSGLSLAVGRAWYVGLPSDRLLTVAFWTIVFGLIGARLFYVIQYHDRFAEGPLGARIAAIADVTKGGLVVYGSLIGGALAAIPLMKWSKLPLWLSLDIIAPAVMIGLALGRIGCFLNGCCFGGYCDVPWAAVQFPPGSAPYMRHLETGGLLGLQTEFDPVARSYRVLDVDPDSIGERMGIEKGELIRIRSEGDRVFRDRITNKLDIDSYVLVESDRVDQRILSIDQFVDPPLDRSLAVHPTQIYSAINAALIAGLLWFAFPWRRRDGDLIGGMFILYAATRFLLEMVRADEYAIDPYGWLTVSQWVSVGMFAAGVLVLLLGRWRPVATPGLDRPRPVMGENSSS